jgi:Ca2+-binding RTX toxin-like protein
LAGQGTDWVMPTINVDLALLGGGHIENVWQMGSASINASGNSAANVLVGNGGNNVLSGGGGNDTIAAGLGNDTLNGGAGVDDMTGGTGNDTYFADQYDSVSETAGSGIDTVVATSDYLLTLASGDVENLTIVAGVDNFSGWGNSLANKITGNDDENTLNGGAGVDTLIGGGGDDIYVVDRIEEIAELIEDDLSGGTDQIFTPFSVTLSNTLANIENVGFLGSKNADAVGNDSDNRFILCLISGSSR